MKLDNIEWLFFDVGSTLVSEEKPFLHRLHEIADAVNEPFDAIQNKVSIVLQEGETIAFKWIDSDELRAMSRDNLATMRQLNFIEELT